MKLMMDKRIIVWMVVVCLGGLISSAYEPPDSYLIDCGSGSNTTVGDRVFLADSLSLQLGFLSTPNQALATTTTTLEESISDDDYSQLYQTARVFTGTAKYTFSISKMGRHWIRLYLNPFDYDGYKMSTANFSVTIPNYILLHNFNTNSTIIKEFSVNLTSTNLVITITPSSGNSIAFLNALEVVSMPDEVANNVPTVPPASTFPDIWRQALETVWRVNMGGSLVTLRNDSLWRTWVPDKPFLVNPNSAASYSNVGAVNYVVGMSTPNVAPASVYGTAVEMNNMEGNPNMNFNITWKFDVDVGFRYLVRFHFCDIVSRSLNQLYFNVYMDSSVLIQALDLSSISSQTLAAAYYYDIVTATPLKSSKMLVKVGPTTAYLGPKNAILNGLEIMKINNSVGSLSSKDIIGVPGNSGSKKVALIIAAASGGGFIVTVAAVLLFMLFRGRRRRRRRRRPLANEAASTKSSWVPLSSMINKEEGTSYHSASGGSPGPALGLRFLLGVVQAATNNFDESVIIGNGGFGKVYRGILSDGTKVAVKRGSSESQQGMTEFRNEIEMLSKFRHRHLVSLIGYCDENKEMILIYEYMENGPLKTRLYPQSSQHPSLTWTQRLDICIGAARGLHYLHTSHAKAVIHRDVKSANILLDENLMAKVADFGLSKSGPELDQTHVSTAVKGSFGYLDPEYFRRQQLTEKSDVYSFGVVMLEVLCGRPVIDPSLPRDRVNLVEWVMTSQKKGQLDGVIDPVLAVRPDSLRKFVETADKCLAEYGVDRPSMADVLWNLEYAYQLQAAAAAAAAGDHIHDHGDDNTSRSMTMMSLKLDDNSLSHVDRILAAAHFEESSSVGVDDSSSMNHKYVFSQLMNSQGR